MLDVDSLLWSKATLVELAEIQSTYIPCSFSSQSLRSLLKAECSYTHRDVMMISLSILGEPWLTDLWPQEISLSVCMIRLSECRMELPGSYELSLAKQHKTQQ